MRLGQLARKLALRPSEIVEFLATKHIQIDDGSNTRLLDDHVLAVMQQFAPADTQDVVAELAKEKEVIETPVVQEVQPVFVAEANNVSEPEVETRIELIKAPKVELSGLKVLGKIELPEPKKKEPIIPSTDSESEVPSSEPEKKAPREIRKSNYSNQKRPNQRRDKNPISAQREQEAEERQRKREAKAQEEKEQRTKNYLKRVTSAPTKRVKMVEEPVMEMSDAELAPPPATLLGKFFRWLKT